MKILLVNVTYSQGSTGKIVSDQYQSLTALGHEVKVCYGRGELLNNSDIIRVNTSLGVNLHGIKTRLLGNVCTGSYRATKKLIRICNEFKPDIVHLHNLHGYYINAYKLLDYLKSSKIKVVLTMHDEWIYTGKCGHPYSCERWMKSCGKCPQLKEYPKSLFFDKTKKEINKKKEIFDNFNDIIFVSVSQWLKQRAQKSAVLRKMNHDVIFNGIETKIFTPKNTEHLVEEYRVLQDKMIILYVTPRYDDPRKGSRFIIELAKKLENERIHFIMVGIPATVIKTLPNNITGLERTENQDKLAEYYSFANATIVTSELETFCMIAAESMCCGTPVIGFAAGGIVEVAPSPKGYFVPFGEVRMLGKLILDIIHGSIKFASSEDCSAYGKKMFSKEKMVCNYMRIYKKL